jgi:hypothetical protein
MKWLAKPFLWIFTCAIPVFIAACYGSVYNDDPYDGGTSDTDTDTDTDTDSDVDAGQDAGAK